MTISLGRLLTFLGLILLWSLPQTLSSQEIFEVKEKRKIEFEYFVGLLPLKGFFLVEESEFFINFEKPHLSKLTLILNLNKSSAGFGLATTAMLSKEVLFAKKFPKISFKSKKITYSGNTFSIIGEVNIRGVSKVITISADLKNRSILDNKKAEQLSFFVTSIFKRSDFNANGYQYLVSDEIKLTSKMILRLKD